MPNHSNSINLRGYLISAIIDHKYTPLEVFQYWQQIAPAFPFLGQVLLNREELTWDNRRMIAVINNTEAPLAPMPKVSMSGDAEILDAYFGIPVYQPGVQETNELMVAFMLPELPEDSNSTLSWSLGPSIRLGLTRNIVFESPYFILSIDINPGVWGYRHLQYKAIEEVFQQLNSMEGAHALEGEIAREAANLSARLHAWETTEVDFQRVREQLWAAAYQLAEKFSRNGKAAIMQEVNASGAPYDLPVNKPGTHMPEIPVYELATFKHGVWMEQMSWGSATLDRTIAYWTARKTTSEWDDFYNTCMQAYKGSWPAVVKVLTQPPVSDVDMERLLYFTADPNWPGASEAMLFMQAQGPAALKSIDAAIEEASKQKDEWWLENLQWIRNWITGADINFEEGNIS